MNIVVSVFVACLVITLPLGLVYYFRKLDAQDKSHS